jgi:hypothetical protein
MRDGQLGSRFSEQSEWLATFDDGRYLRNKVSRQWPVSASNSRNSGTVTGRFVSSE